MKKYSCTVLLVGMLIISMFHFYTVQSSNIKVIVTKFSDDRDAVEFTFANPGSKKDDCIALQTGLIIKNASLTISGKPFPEGSQNYPLDPWVDIGEDGIEEWRFSGEGYGMMGMQVVFANNASSVRMTINSSLENRSLNLRFPKGCTIVGGTIDITPIAWSGILSIKFDISADGVYEWSVNNLTKTTRIQDIASAIQAYVSSAQPTGGDDYVKYVDVPIKVKSNITCTIEFTNISIAYTYSPTISIKNALEKHLSNSIGESTMRISIRVGSSGPCKILLQSLYIEAEPPIHKPTIFNISPAEDKVKVNESESIVFSIEWKDIYGNPCIIRWYLDGKRVGKDNETVYVYSPDYESSGKHIVDVVVDNNLDKNKHTWNVEVINVNRAPVVSDWYPKKNPKIWEGKTQTFNVTAYDPDGTTLKFRWYFDDEEVPGEEKSEYTYYADYESSGKHKVMCEVYDGEGGFTNISWDLSVRNTNRAPVIASHIPKEKDVEVEESSTIKFEVRASDPDGDIVEYQYILDTDIISSNMSAIYTPSYEDAGYHTLTVIVSDGILSTSYEWTIYVKDKNRNPICVIKSPEASEIYEEYENVTLDASGSYDPDGDNLTFTWLLDGNAVAECKTASIGIPRGNHTIALEVSDGRGGIARDEVHVNVGYVELKIDVKVPSEVKEGDICKIRCIVENGGNLKAENVNLRIYIDDKIIDETEISVDPGSTEYVEFIWTAEKGSHKINVIAEGLWGKTEVLKRINVEQKFSFVVMLAIAIILIGVGATPAIVFIRKKKVKKPIPPSMMYPHQSMSPQSPPIPYPSRTPPQPHGAPPHIQSIPPSAPIPAPPGAPITSQSQSIPPPTPPPTETDKKDMVKVADHEVREGVKDEKKDIEIQTTFEGHAPRAVEEDLSSGKRAFEVDEGPEDADEKTIDVDVKESIEEKEKLHEKDSEEEPTPTPSPEPSAPSPSELVEEAQPPPHISEEKTKNEEAKEIIEDAERMLEEAEKIGAKTLIAKRALDLARSFYKTDNYLKAIQYSKKAQNLLRGEIERLKVGTAKCPSCDEDVENDWKVCPSCGEKLR